MKWPELSEILNGIPWAAVGAVATRLYMPERMTRDLDIVVTVAQSAEAKERLSRAGWTLLGSLSIGGTAWRSPERQEVDVIEVTEGWWADALQQAQTNRDASGLPILPFPCLILMKFRASRTVDIGDITRMLGLASDETLEATRDLFRREEPEGLEDLESLIELGRWELHGDAGSR